MMLMGVSMLVVALDQFTKFLVLRSMDLNESIALLPGVLYLTYIQNPGTAFGFMSDLDAVVRIPFFVAITIGAALIVYTYYRLTPPDRSFTRLALGLVLGGAFGNFVDRLLHGKVIDFIDMRYEEYHWYVFNVADTCITVGLSILLIEFLLGTRRTANG